MKVFGVMQICDSAADIVHLAVGAMSGFCDKVFFLTNPIRDARVYAAIESCPNLGGIREQPASPGHDYGEGLVYGYHWLNGFGQCDWVVLPDHDEILPYAHLRDELLAAETLGRRAVTFPFINCWGDPETIVDPRLNLTGDHCKAYRAGDPSLGRPEIAGFNIPRGYWDGSCYGSRWPVRHCHMMTPDMRQRHRPEPWAASPPPTLAFREDWMIQDYQAAVTDRTLIDR